MTTHQKAMIWVAITYLFSLDQVFTVAHSLRSLVEYLVLLPLTVYAVVRLAMIAWRVRVVILPYQEFTPRCPECESRGFRYNVTRVAAKITEHWNNAHEHRVTVKTSSHMECDRGHFVEFRKRDTTVKRTRKGMSLAKRLRALRKGFHEMYAVDQPTEALDAQAG